MTLRVGMSTPTHLFDLSAADRRAMLTDVADAGIDHLFSADHVSFRGGHGEDILVHLAALSGIEPRLGLYAGVYLLALRHPVVAARQIISLASVAPGRVTIGVGVGGEDRNEFLACGVDPATRGRRTDVALDIIRRLLAGETVSNDDEFFRLDEVRMRPVPDPVVPFVVGGRSAAAARRAGALGDGWLAAWTTPERFAVGVADAEQAAADAGRQPDWQHGYQIWVGIGADPAEGRVHVSAAMEQFYRMPFEPFERFTPLGTPEQIAETLRPFVDAGARVLNIKPCGPDRSSEIAAVAAIRELLGSS